jgi:hypothetical protein
MEEFEEEGGEKRDEPGRVMSTTQAERTDGGWKMTDGK